MREREGLPLSHMTGFEQRLLARVRARGLESPGLLVVGYSGGGDSLALAAGLGRLRDRGLGPAIALVHVDHGLRAGSAGDALRAAGIAGELGLPCRIATIRPGDLAAHCGVGVEEAARRERYRLLAQACRETGASAVALGHHREDQAESVLLHLLRGAGTAGAAGMAEWTSRPVPWWPGEAEGEPVAIWRPLLGEPQSALRDFVASSGLAPVHDPSNDDRGYTRNRIRLDILPMLEAADPGAAQAVARHADLAAADDDALDAMARVALARASGADGELLAAALAGEPLAIRRRAARAWLLSAAPAAEPGLDQAEALLAALERNRGGAVIEIGGGERVRIERGAARLMGREEDGENR